MTPKFGTWFSPEIFPQRHLDFFIGHPNSVPFPAAASGAFVTFEPAPQLGSLILGGILLEPCISMDLPCNFCIVFDDLEVSTNLCCLPFGEKGTKLRRRLKSHEGTKLRRPRPSHFLEFGSQL